MNRQSTTRTVVACCLAGALAACGSPHAAAEHDPGGREDPIDIQQAADRSTFEGSAENFSGKALVKMLFGPNESRRGAAATVEFQAGARTAWHTHPLGQTLVVTKGKGWVQEWGGAKLEMTAGDVVWIPPGVKHWHGATSTERMTHIAVQEQRDGKVVDWMELVTDEHYLGAGPVE